MSEVNPVQTIGESTPNYEGITLLLKNLDLTPDDVTRVGEGMAGPTIELSNGEEWAVLTDEQADEWCRQDIEGLLDDVGIGAFNLAPENYVQNVEDFRQAMLESYQSYVEDISTEPASSDEFDSRLSEEMAEAGVGSEAEYIDHLIGDQDPIQWVKDNFGDEEVKRLAIIDSQALTDDVVASDGRGHVIATYDGDEVELGKDFFGYRLN